MPLDPDFWLDDTTATPWVAKIVPLFKYKDLYGDVTLSSGRVDAQPMEMLGAYSQSDIEMTRKLFEKLHNGTL